MVWGEAFAQDPLTMLEVRIVQYVTCTSYLVREYWTAGFVFLNISFCIKNSRVGNNLLFPYKKPFIFYARSKH